MILIIIRLLINILNEITFKQIENHHLYISTNTCSTLNIFNLFPNFLMVVIALHDDYNTFVCLLNDYLYFTITLQ